MLTQLADLANIVMALAALAALWGAAWQVRESERAQREATASELYSNYLTKAIEYPQYAGAHRAVVDAAPGSEAYERYEWFVSLMLHAFEQILDLTKDDEIWRKAIVDQIAYHQAYLSSPQFVRVHYSPALQQLLPPASAARQAAAR